MGSSDGFAYDGESMAKKGVVFVTVNYRVDIFGFLAHPELSKEAEYGASGNYGLLDELAALKWVRDNIAAFGGNPDCVSIAGTSAGGKSVNFFACSPLAKGLFHRGIAQSGVAFGAPGMAPASVHMIQPISFGESLGREFSESIEKTIDEMRNMPAEELLLASKKTSHNMCRPFIDGYVIPASPYEIYAEGKQNDVALIVGNCADEVGLMMGMADAWLARFNKEAHDGQIQKIFGSLAECYNELYPADEGPQALASYISYFTDHAYTSQNRTWARLQNETGNPQTPIYAYIFSRIPEDSPEEITKLMAHHGSEMGYAYGNLHLSPRIFNDADKKVSSAMQEYWVNFAKTGNPNGDNLPTWEPFGKGEGIMELGDTMGMIANYRHKELDFLDKYEEKIRASK